LAVAVMFFNPRTVMIIAIKPLIQVIFMMGFLRFSPIIKEYWSEYVDDTDLVKKIY
jgi:ACR3 family arsenite efflux pump ArsB